MHFDAPSIKSSTVDLQLEHILDWAQKNFGSEELVQAKEEFFWSTGKVFHDDQFYEERMNHFLDFFILDRPVRTHQNGEFRNSPLYLFYAKDPTPPPTSKSENPQRVSSFICSVFQILRVNENSMSVFDLYNRETLSVVSERTGENFSALAKGQVFQGYLYGLANGNYVMSKGIMFHPSRAIGEIRKKVRKIHRYPKLSFSKALSQFAKQHLRFLRNPGIDPRRIYSEAPF